MNVSQVQKDIEKILFFVGHIQSVDTKDVKPLASLLGKSINSVGYNISRETAFV